MNGVPNPDFFQDINILEQQQIYADAKLAYRDNDPIAVKQSILIDINNKKNKLYRELRDLKRYYMFKDIDIKCVGAAVGLILTIGGGFTWFGVTNNKLDALSNVKSTVTENSKRTEINQKEIELLKLQIKEIQLKSGNPLSN